MTNGDGDEGDRPTYVDTVEDYSDGMVLFLKTQRVLLTFAYMLLLGLAIFNVWHYLIK